jgi:signal transduction histidine kinase
VALGRVRRRLESLRSAVSHDVTTPLNLATGRLELAADDCDSPHLSRATDALAELEALIDTHLAYVRAGYPVENPETVSLETMAHECWAALAPDDRAVTFEPPGTDHTVTGDPERIRRLCLELFENALAHSDGDLRLSVDVLTDRSGFSVVDTGPGVPAADREYVFERGYAVDPGDRGAGLAIVAEIAEAHGWSVDLSTGDDGGTRVDISTDPWQPDPAREEG